MAKVKIQGHASGTGILTVTAPDTSSDRTITLPDATGTLATTADITSLAGIDDQSSSNDDQLTIKDTEVVINDDGDDLDFRIESDAITNALFVDGGTGNIGIGVNPEAWDSSRAVIQLGTSSGGSAALYSTHDAVGMGENFYNNSGDKYINTSEATQYYQTDGSHVWKVAASGSADAAITWITAMDITNAGHINVGKGTDQFLYIGNTSSFYSRIESGRPGTGSQDHINFSNANGTVGSISTSGTATAFNTSSDYRLKENVDYTWDATTRLKQLKPARFNFIADDTTTVDGFVAHEVSSVVPEAIKGTKDETETLTNAVVMPNGLSVGSGISEAEWTTGKADGTYPADSTWAASHTQDVWQAIDQSKLVPLLVKTIQELEARITALEA